LVLALSLAIMAAACQGGGRSASVPAPSPASVPASTPSSVPAAATAPCGWAACQADDLLFTAFQHDLQSDQFPTFAFITPNGCHDTHDCSVATGDAWLAGMLPAVLAGPAYRSGTTAVMVIWDEPTPMADLIIGPSVRPGTVVATPVDHYSLLRTTEERLGISTPLGAAATAPSLRIPFGL